MQFMLPRAAWHGPCSRSCVMEPGLQQPLTTSVVDQPVPAGQPHGSTPPVLQSMLPKLVWQLATSEPCVRLPGLQQPTPVVIDQPVPSGQPHSSTAPLKVTVPIFALFVAAGLLVERLLTVSKPVRH